MDKDPFYLHIALFKPMRHCFDYLLPEEIKPYSLKPGIRIQVPFGNKQTIGILLAVNQTSCVDIKKIKPISAILDAEPLITPALLSLYTWASRYYQHPIGEVMLGTLPALLRRETIPRSRNSQPKAVRHAMESALVLNPEQQQALQRITASEGFETFLLEGITGSGKTEIYLQAIAYYLTAGKQALVLVPEIGLTPQTIARFERRFSVPVAMLHSRLSDRQRLNTWIKAKNGEVSIVIGTRSAIFTPFARLGIIIIDEEHDHSFKQQSGFRYSARDVAIFRGSLENIPIVLGTATPSLESLNNAQTQRYTRLSLPYRAGKAQLPSLQLVDLRNQYLEEGLSNILLGAIREHLNQHNQVLLFLNRRGYAPVFLCHSCGWSAVCQRCDAKLTLHQKPPRLICHHCATTYSLPKLCGRCASTQLFSLGFGTERLEEVLQSHFPGKVIVRIDRDAIRHKNAMENMLKKIHDGEGQILIGTQMLAKGHHFPNVTLVGIIDMDAALYSTDFRANEQMGQLILQVAGRAGRAEKPGQVYLQTHHPNHPLLQSLIHSGYGDFSLCLLQERRAAMWPPFSFLALLRAEARQKKGALGFLDQAKCIVENLKDTRIQLLGPIPAPMERKAGVFRGLMLLQATQRQALQQWLPLFVPKLEALRCGHKVRWSLDIDPLEMF